MAEPDHDIPEIIGRHPIATRVLERVEALQLEHRQIFVDGLEKFLKRQEEAQRLFPHLASSDGPSDVFEWCFLSSVLQTVRSTSCLATTGPGTDPKFDADYGKLCGLLDVLRNERFYPKDTSLNHSP